MHYKKMLLIFAAAIVLILTACGKKNLETVPETKPPVDAPAQSEEEQEEVFYQFPLTGIKTEIEPEGRVVAATINNHPAARPQSGLSKADIVYEVLAEGNTTRFLALFQSEQPENIGPIRSARDYFIELAQGYNSLYVAHGYSPEAKEMLLAGEIDQLNGMQHDGTLFKRATTSKSPAQFIYYF